MPILKNPKHERVAQELAKGRSAAQAYIEAGYKANRHNASALARTQPIKTRVSELLEKRERVDAKATEKAVEKLALTKEWVIDKLIENVERALQARPVRGKEGEEQGEYQYQGSVANRALELLGKELGMFIDRKELGKPGEFESMTDEELDSCIAELLSPGKAGSGKGAQGMGASPSKRMQKPH
ncbi:MULTISPECIES: terminase small subunit [unclassified Bradyrhizobium]